MLLLPSWALSIIEVIWEQKTNVFIFTFLQDLAQCLAHRTKYSGDVFSWTWRIKINSIKPLTASQSPTAYNKSVLWFFISMCTILFYTVTAFLLLFFLLSRSIWSKDLQLQTNICHPDKRTLLFYPESNHCKWVIIEFCKNNLRQFQSRHLWIYCKYFWNGSIGIWGSYNCWTKHLWFSVVLTTLENLVIIHSYSLWMISAFLQGFNVSLIDSLHNLLSQGTFVVKWQNSDFTVIQFVMVFKKLCGRI